MAADRGVTVRTVDIHEDDVTLDLEDLESKLGPRTKLVAVGYASNAVGTINPVARDRRPRPRGRRADLRRRRRVRAARPDRRREPSTPTSSSARVYKWFGPHLGALYGKAEVLDSPAGLQGPAGARPVRDRDPVVRGDRRARWPRPTTCATSAGRTATSPARPGAADASERRRELVAGMTAIVDYERALVTAPDRWPRGDRGRHASTASPTAPRFDERVPTVSVSIDGVHPRAAAEALGRDGIYVWDGDFYATGLIERLGKAETGGVLRLGLVHYNTAAEVDRTLEAVERIAGGPRDVSAGDPSIQATARPRLRPGRAAPDQAAVGPPLDRRGPARHRRADRDAVAGLRLRDRPDRPALGGTRRAREPSTPSCSGRSRTTRSRCPRSWSARRASFEVATLTGTNHGSVGGRRRRPGWPSRSRSSSCSRGTPSRNGSPGSGSGSTAGR